eukprot:7221388-Alexandrium_andersonii.AAC.1
MSRVMAGITTHNLRVQLFTCPLHSCVCALATGAGTGGMCEGSGSVGVRGRGEEAATMVSHKWKLVSSTVGLCEFGMPCSMGR